MSKKETPMIRWYWEQVGGTLCEEYLVVKRSSTTGQRLIDAVIFPNGPKEISHWQDCPIEGRDIIAVQAKNYRLGMYLMGQTFFSAQLLEACGAISVRSVALCNASDKILEPMLTRYPNMEVVVVPKKEKYSDPIVMPKFEIIKP